MRHLAILLLSIFVISCQPQGPTKMEQYETAKTLDAHQLENSFEKRIAEEVENESNELAANSAQAKAELKAALTHLASKSNNKATKGNKINSLTPSTNVEDIEQLDSLASLE